MTTMFRMIRPAILALVLAIASHQSAADELDGLWKAKKRFGPDTRGTLVVQRGAGGMFVDVGGRVVPVTATNGELAFALPNGEGSFRGRLDHGVIAGHWFKNGTQLFSAPNGGALSASPVRLLPDGPNRWRGAISPNQDVFTFYLLLQPRPDGAHSALLRNPEFDLGTQQGVERLVRDGNAVKLIGKRGGKERDVASGTYDPEAKVITLEFPGRGGSYDFIRDSDESGFYP